MMRYLFNRFGGIYIGRSLLLMVLVGWMSGCVSRPQKQGNQVYIAPDVCLRMPAPSDLGYSLTASQLVTVEYADQTRQLPVQLQVDPEKLVLAGFSSWGSRIMSLTYADNEISTSVMTGLGQQLPDPEQILFNLLLALWPASAWEEPLSGIGWTLKEMPGKRELINNQGHIAATIQYEADPYLDGKIVFINHALDLTVTIETVKCSR